MLPPPSSSAGAPAGPDRTYGGNRAFHNFYNDYSHIPDPNLRRRLALSEIDKVPLGLYHVRAVLVAGVGFLLDSYDIFAINLVITMLGMVFWCGNDRHSGYGGNGGALPDPINQALKGSTNAGIIIGMVLFGWLADALGRRRMYGIELAIIIFGTFSCALVSSSPSISSSALLIFWRVLMGIGIGGDYPLSSVITSETARFAPTRWRGAMVAAVFSMQGVGLLMSALVALITTVAFKDSYINIKDETQCDAACQVAADRSWRIIVGVGAIPACLALYYRITIPETPRYTFDVRHDVEKAGADIRAYVHSKSGGDYEGHRRSGTRLSATLLHVPRASWADVFAYFGEWKNLRVLIGTTMSWFLLDLAFYGLGLNSTMVLHAIGFANGNNMYEKLYNQAVGMIILTCAGAIPGYWTAVLTIDTVGRKPLQVFGFLALTVIFCVLGFRLGNLSEGAMLALYVVGQFLFSAGPNTTTFVVPGECFPTRYRSTGHGLSAAMGKLGAVVAQVISIPLLRHGPDESCAGNDCSPHLDRLLQLFALFMLLGTFFSLLIPETKGLTLEELSGESRTSYNAGCNGSINLGPARPRAWNPFSGGQPAGFLYPRSHSGTFALKGGRSERPGIMAAPEHAGSDEQQQRRRRLCWRRRGRRRRAGSDGSNEIALRSRSSRSDGLYDDYVGAATSQQPPAWGAGWGRIDRGGPPPTTSNMQLQDVGMLLKPS
ncbi:major facilitator superfamily protein [Hirsutella rhossiliensis]|uniref:Sugar transporter domain-containing protein n=1 Tax=Hirsutella rhossiliensis TaxID=111463 RepID=A0A9P8MT90_9HYPO|nr:sugar transporter domain-containing protein [Hirsutella rhossiliensis]KAH0961007.1 sugar transporter domain-containing protein [Hirsutella rhossiliensis]